MNILSRLIATLLICAPLAYLAYLSDQEEVSRLTGGRNDLITQQFFVYSFWEAFLIIGTFGLSLVLIVEGVSFCIRKILRFVRPGGEPAGLK